MVNAHANWSGIKGTGGTNQFTDLMEFALAVQDRDDIRGDGGLWNAFWGAPEQLPFFQMIDDFWADGTHRIVGTDGRVFARNLRQDKSFGWISNKQPDFIWNNRQQTWEDTYTGVLVDPDSGGGR